MLIGVYDCTVACDVARTHTVTTLRVQSY